GALASLAEYLGTVDDPSPIRIGPLRADWPVPAGGRERMHDIRGDHAAAAAWARPASAPRLCCRGSGTTVAPRAFAGLPGATGADGRAQGAGMCARGGRRA